MRGTVQWFSSAKGFGFIKPSDGGADVFVHYKGIDMEGYRQLKENEIVEFEIEQGEKGPQACNVRPIRV